MRKKLIQKLQQQVLLGTHVTFTLETSEQVSGLLAGIGLQHIILDRENEQVELLLETIVDFQIGPPGFSNLSPKPEHLVGSEEQISAKLAEIDNWFGTKIHSSTLKLKLPNLTFPAIAAQLTNWRNTDVFWAWKQIEKEYNNAQKIGELSPKFGKIDSIVAKAKSLVERFPVSVTLKQALAYFYSISDNWDEALHYYQESAVQSEDPKDWFNVAVSALKLNKEDLTCYSLEKFFYEVSITDELQAWRVYVNCLGRFNNLPAFCELCITNKDNMDEKQIKTLLEASIYLLKQTNAGELAIEIVKKQLIGKPSKFLLEEACKGLDGQPIESYRQFLTIVAPGGRDLYKEALQAEQSGNLESAEHLYWECIREDIKFEEAIQKLATTLVDLKRQAEAAKLLEDNKHRIEDKQALNDTLINVYRNVLKLQELDEKERFEIRLKIARAHINLENYEQATLQFGKALKLQTNNISLQRSLAQQNFYTEAEGILNQIHDTTLDAKTAKLLEEAKKEIKEKGQLVNDLSQFARFFLESAPFRGVSSKRLIEGKYNPASEQVALNEMEDLKRRAFRDGPSRSDIRSELFLTAAKIGNMGFGDPNLFYQYLCCSFTSMGDIVMLGNQDLDIAQEWYRESLILFDKVSVPDVAELDAAFSLTRCLYAISGSCPREFLPPQARVPRHIGETIEKIINDSAKPKEVFDAITYLISRSQYAAKEVLVSLDSNPVLRSKALSYLKEMGITFSSPVNSRKEFRELWDELRYKQRDKEFNISNKLLILKNFKISRDLLEDSIRMAESVIPDLFFKLDKRRVTELIELLRTALAISDAKVFKSKVDQCKILKSNCKERLTDIKRKPTKLSVEVIYSIIETIQDEVFTYFNNLYENLKPQLQLKLAMDEQSEEPYVRSPAGKIQVPVVVKNEENRMPAESVELVVKDNDTSFEVIELPVPLESLPGGKPETLRLHLLVRDDTTVRFSLSVSIKYQYRTHSGEKKQINTDLRHFPIHLSDEFEKIDNPYVYAEGGIVGKKMFYGRQELIEKIAFAIRTSREQSKSILVFGQYRSGKSSVLYHLKEELIKQKDNNKNLLILYMDDISGFMDEGSTQKFQYQILMGILTKLQQAIKDRIEIFEVNPLGFSIPSAQEFYSHPTKQQYFQEILEELRNLAYKEADWQNVRVVLLIDEFQDIYDKIINGKLPENYMRSWKTLLQANHFSAVFVGQAVMQKFKNRYPNEFGTMQETRVTYLAREDAKGLIDEPILIGGRGGTSRYLEGAIDRIIDLTAGSPFYIQIICNRLVDYMNDRKTKFVTQADVEYVKDGLIEGSKAFQRDKFDNFLTSGDKSHEAISSEDALEVLKVIAKNSETGSCPRDRISCPPLSSSEVGVILEDLVAREVVEPQENSYRIRVGLFKEWLVVNC